MAKVFTSSVIEFLQDYGVLTIQDKITDFYHDWSETNQLWEEVTLHDALRHIFGFTDDFMDIDEDKSSFQEEKRGKEPCIQDWWGTGEPF